MKKFLILLLALLCLAAPAMAENRVIDHANLLTSKEESALESTIEKIAAEYRMDVVILLENSIDQSPRYYAADFYDYGGYGYGDSHDGILFLLSMEERDYFTLTTGSAIRAFTDYGLEQIHGDIVPYLSAGDYANAFQRYLIHVEKFLEQDRLGQQYDLDHPLRFDSDSSAFDYGISYVSYSVSPLEQANAVFPIILIIALVIALITVFIMKGQMKTIRRKAGAASYVKEGSFQLTRQQDIYLYTTTRRRKIETNSSGGSSTFRGSSGRSHGGGGGKF